MGKLTQISIYPIKSCAGIDLKQADVHDRGFPFDRRWMLIEEDGVFLSQRNSPELGQVLSMIRDNLLQISYPGIDPLTLDINHIDAGKIEAKIWKDTVMSRRVSSIADDWFSRLLGRPVHLVHMDSEISRPLEKNRLPQDRSYEVSFADGYPYLLTNQASLDDLNGRLETPIQMDRFRSNLVVEGFGAFFNNFTLKSSGISFIVGIL